jgi:hypothetical protein
MVRGALGPAGGIGHQNSIAGRPGPGITASVRHLLLLTGVPGFPLAGSSVFRTAQDTYADEDLRTGIAHAEYNVAFEIDQIDLETGRGWIQRSFWTGPRGAAGAVSSVSTPNFTLTTTAGNQQVTVSEGAFTTYQKGFAEWTVVPALIQRQPLRLPRSPR